MYKKGGVVVGGLFQNKANVLDLSWSNMLQVKGVFSYSYALQFPAEVIDQSGD